MGAGEGSVAVAVAAVVQRVPQVQDALCLCISVDGGSGLQGSGRRQEQALGVGCLVRRGRAGREPRVRPNGRRTGKAGSREAKSKGIQQREQASSSCMGDV